MQAERDAIDPIRELRLRTWARRHHVPAAERDSRWHHVILEEMARRDVDLASVERAERERQDWIGPLLVESQRRLEAGRRELAALRGTAVVAVERPAEFAVVVETTISAFVPLAPGPIHVLHEAHVTLPGPHVGLGRDRTETRDLTAVPECW